MAQTTVLATGTADGTQSDIVIATSGNVGIFTSGTFTNNTVAEIFQKTPANNIYVGALNSATPSLTISSAGTYVVVRTLRQSDGVSFGVFTDI